MSYNVRLRPAYGVDRYLRDWVEVPLSRLAQGTPEIISNTKSWTRAFFKRHCQRPAIAFMAAAGVMTAAASPVYNVDIGQATAEAVASTLMSTASPTAVTVAGLHIQAQAPAEVITTPKTDRLDVRPFDMARLTSAFTPVALTPVQPVQMPSLYNAPLPQIAPEIYSQDPVVTGEPLVSEHRAGRRHLRAALSRSAGRMDRLGITADSVIAVHEGRPITLKAALSDRDIHQVPPIPVFASWCAALSKYGFSRRRYDVSSYERAYNLPARTLSALRSTESGGFMAAVSYARDGGALGPFQIMWDTARGLDIDDPFDPHQAATGAARYMRGAIIASGGNMRQAFARYNTGHANVDRNIRRNRGQFRIAAAPRETQGHAARAIRYMGGDAQTPVQAIDSIIAVSAPVEAAPVLSYTPAM